MKNKYCFAVSAALLVMAARPQLLAQPGSHPYVFYSEDGSGSSYLGVQTQDVTADRLGALHLKEERGVEITTVDQDAPASKAGLKEHDVILSVNDQKIESVEQLKRVIREIPAGRTISIGLSRDGQPMTLKAQLAERDKMEMGRSFNFTMPPMPAINVPAIHIPPINLPDMDFAGGIVVMHSPARSGLMVENLTPQLGDFFGVKNGSGVLIRSVEKGSRGEQAGFRAGDVVIKIDGSAVNDCSDFTRLLRKRTDNKASVTVMRDRKEQNLTLTLPERHSGGLNQRSGCVSDDWEDCAADLKADVAELIPAIRTAARGQLQPEMQRLQKQMARMQPQMENLQKEVQREVQSHQQELRKEMEKLQKDLRRQEEDIKEQIRTWVNNSEI